MEMFNRIKFDGAPAGTPWLIYKYPSESFVLGSQLIVSQGQEALFVKGGEAADLFCPGTHTLTTGNLPILNKLANLPFGGKTPFTAEIFYINKTANLDMKWGTTSRFPLEDPKYGIILNIGARGQYGMNIVDSRLFVSRMIGAVPHGTLTDDRVVVRYFNGMIDSKVKSVAAEYMVKKQISFLDITQYLEELSDILRSKLSEEFERFGIEIVNFYCVSLAPDPEEYERLRSYKEELALGQGFYQQRRSLDILESLADNPSSGGLANAGIGLGMGLGLLGQINQPISEVGQALNAGAAGEGQAGIGVQNSRIKCPKCGAFVQLGMKFCGQCGSQLISPQCPFCGFENEPGMRFCGNCGRELPR